MAELVIEALGDKPNGTMVPTISTLPDNTEGEVVFIIKEDRHYINKAGTEPIINTRTSVVESDAAFAFLNMFSFNGDKDLIYDCWLNYHNKVGKKMIEKLCTQDRIIFEYRDNNMKKIKQFMIDNCLAVYAREYVIKSFEYGYWSDEEFEIVKNSIRAKYPDCIDLWNELGINEN